MPPKTTPPSAVTAKMLSTLPLFAGVPLSELERLLDCCAVVRFEPNTVVFRQGDPSTHALLLVSGALEASTHVGGERKVLGRIRAGELAGESGLMALTESRGATLTATHTIQALRLQAHHLAELTGTSVLASLQMRMLSGTARRLRTTRTKMQHSARLPQPPPTTAEGAAPTDEAHTEATRSRWTAFLDALGALV